MSPPPRQVTGTMTQGAGVPATPWYMRVVDAVGTAMDVALDATVQQLRDRFPAAAALPGASFPATTRVGAVLIGRDTNTLAPGHVNVSSSGSVLTSTTLVTFASTTRTVGGVYEQQRGITFSSQLGCVEIFVDPTASTIGTVGGREICGYLLLVNSASAAVNGVSTPHGGHVYPVVPGEHLLVQRFYSEVFTSGVRAVLSTTPNVVTLGLTGLFTVKTFT